MKRNVLFYTAALFLFIPSASASAGTKSPIDSITESIRYFEYSYSSKDKKPYPGIWRHYIAEAFRIRLHIETAELSSDSRHQLREHLFAVMKATRQVLDVRPSRLKFWKKLPPIDPKILEILFEPDFKDRLGELVERIAQYDEERIPIEYPKYSDDANSLRYRLRALRDEAKLPEAEPLRLEPRQAGYLMNAFSGSHNSFDFLLANPILLLRLKNDSQLKTVYIFDKFISSRKRNPAPYSEKQLLELFDEINEANVDFVLYSATEENLAGSPPLLGIEAIKAAAQIPSNYLHAFALRDAFSKFVPKHRGWSGEDTVPGFVWEMKQYVFDHPAELDKVLQVYRWYLDLVKLIQTREQEEALAQLHRQKFKKPGYFLDSDYPILAQAAIAAKTREQLGFFLRQIEAGDLDSQTIFDRIAKMGEGQLTPNVDPSGKKEEYPEWLKDPAAHRIEFDPLKDIEKETNASVGSRMETLRILGSEDTPTSKLKFSAEYFLIRAIVSDPRAARLTAKEREILHKDLRKIVQLPVLPTRELTQSLIDIAEAHRGETDLSEIKDRLLNSDKIPTIGCETFWNLQRKLRLKKQS